MQVSEIEMLVYNQVSCVEFLNQEPIARNLYWGFLLQTRGES